ncbi:hypothetical protein K0U91_01130 [Chryseobacterium chendengshani]|uniref:hypothetical protein n=1 Tax=Chryseobacterium sp. LJ668 TaxID=2864040 RepID=UPI001C693821|nr:hypothetical protein [Chryseobacterium sp. LJ668]MBW8523827.1 hypothetical protein [Chryseobacterium sp. LJ668]QYK16770.1 hypothetical protein K0U91_01130 [Chryseobacterium sp. LJ668]
MEQEEKDDIQLAIESLRHFNKQYRDAYHDYRNGRNAKIRKEGSRVMDNASGMIEIWLKSNDKVLGIASGGERPEGFDRRGYFISIFSRANLEQEVKDIIEKLEKLLSEESTGA